MLVCEEPGQRSVQEAGYDAESPLQKSLCFVYVASLYFGHQQRYLLLLLEFV